MTFRERVFVAGIHILIAELAIWGASCVVWLLQVAPLALILKDPFVAKTVSIFSGELFAVSAKVVFVAITTTVVLTLALGDNPERRKDV